MKAESHSTSELLTVLLQGPIRKGAVIGREHLRFGDYVVTLTSPGGPRMPNGVECRLNLAAAARVAIGRGRLSVGRLEIHPGADWDPVPRFDHFESLPPGPEPIAGALGSWLAASSPGYDALLAGYLAGLVLLHGQRKRAEQIVTRTVDGSTPLNLTLLRHAARGEVPEPVHAVLATRDTSRLIAFAPSGIVWLRGLVSAGLPLEMEATVAAGGAPAVATRRR